MESSLLPSLPKPSTMHGTVASPITMLATLRTLTLVPARGFATSAIAFAGKRRVADPTLPKVPKGGDSPYVSFFKDFFPREKAKFTGEDGKLKLTELAAAAGAAWKAIGESELATYNARSAESRAQANEVYKAFYSELSPETIRAIEKATGKALRKPGGKKAYNKALADRPGNPGRPLTSFFVFMKELREQAAHAGEGSLAKEQGIAKEAGEKWRAMSDEAKKVYVDKAAAGKKAFEEWEKSQAK